MDGWKIFQLISDHQQTDLINKAKLNFTKKASSLCESGGGHFECIFERVYLIDFLIRNER